MRLLTWLTLLLFLPFCHSCKSPDKKPSDAEEILKSAESGDFRNVNIGDAFSDVLNREGDHMVYSMPDELMYRIPLDQKDSTFYEITYNFNEDGLYNILLEIFPADNSQLKDLSEDFFTFYINRYGPAQKAETKSEWRVMTAEGHFVRVTIADSVQKNNRPCLRIHFDEYN